MLSEELVILNKIQKILKRNIPKCWRRHDWWNC